MHPRYRNFNYLLLATLSLNLSSHLAAQEGCVDGEVCLQEVLNESSTQGQLDVQSKVLETLPQLPSPDQLQGDAVTTLTDTQEQQDLVDGISRNLKIFTRSMITRSMVKNTLREYLYCLAEKLFKKGSWT